MSVISGLTSRVTDPMGIDLQEHDFLRVMVKGARKTLSERITKVAFVGLVFIVFLGIFGPMLAPYNYETQLLGDSGLLRLESPSAAHPLGTNDRGQDVLSRLLVGARPTVITGFLGGFIMLVIGTTVGVTAGYVGGTTETVLMRFTDLMFGIPVIPFAIVLLAFLGAGFYVTILVIGLILWRFIARVLRAQVLQIKQRPYIMAAKISGASRTRIILKHILPNVASMAVLFFALGVGLAILKQAGLAFIGLTNPFVPSWGIMIRNAHDSGYLAEAWWWAFPPGIMISITVLSLYLIGRGYEQTSQDEHEVV